MIIQIILDVNIQMNQLEMEQKSHYVNFSAVVYIAISYTWLSVQKPSIYSYIWERVSRPIWWICSIPLWTATRRRRRSTASHQSKGHWCHLLISKVDLTIETWLLLSWRDGKQQSGGKKEAPLLHEASKITRRRYRKMEIKIAKERYISSAIASDMIDRDKRLDGECVELKGL